MSAGPAAAHGRHRGRSAAIAVGAALLALAVARELSRPAAERSWNGSVLGVPYDLRPPTLERLRRRWWDPDDPRLLTPHVFGVGWSLNLGRVVRLLRDAGD